MILQAIFEYSAKDKSISSEGKDTSENISSTSWGQTCINESMSGIGFVYETVGGCLFLWTSPTELIHDKICFGFFSACSIECTFEYFPPMYCLRLFIIISSILALSDWFRHGSSWVTEKILECSIRELRAVRRAWAFWGRHRLNRRQECNRGWRLWVWCQVKLEWGCIWMMGREYFWMDLKSSLTYLLTWRLAYSSAL